MPILTVWALKDELDRYPDDYEVVVRDIGDPTVGIPESTYGIYKLSCVIDDDFRPQRGTVILTLEP